MIQQGSAARTIALATAMWLVFLPAVPSYLPVMASSTDVTSSSSSAVVAAFTTFGNYCNGGSGRRRRRIGLDYDEHGIKASMVSNDKMMIGNCVQRYYDDAMVHSHPIARGNSIRWRKRANKVPSTLAAVMGSCSSSSLSSSSISDAECATESSNQMPLSQLLGLLNERNVRYAPDATRSQLEQLLLDLENDDDDDDTTTTSTSSSNSKFNTHAKTEEAEASSADNNVSASYQTNEREKRETTPSTTIPPIISNNSENSKNTKSNNKVVVDAVVLDDPRVVEQSYDDDNVQSKREGRYQSSFARPQQQQQQRQQQQAQQHRQRYGRAYSQQRQEQQQQQRQTYGQSRRKYANQRSRSYQNQESSRQPNPRYYQQQYYRQRQRRQQQQYQQSQRRRRMYTDPRSENDFHLLDDEDDSDAIYDNGMQIFLMGFYEAGKTATQLAVDAINPFSGNVGYDDDDDERYEDGRRGRDGVLDVDILEYSPRRMPGGRRWGGREDGRGRRPERRRGRGSRRQRDAYDANNPRRWRREDDGDRDGYGASGYYRYDGVAPSERRRRRTATPADYGASMEERGGEPPLGDEFSANQSLTTPPLSLPGRTTRRRRSRRGNYDYDEREGREGNSRPIYGLYRNDNDDEPDGESRTRRRREQDDRREWKDRLRRKFDAALGLQDPSSSSSPSTGGETSYYDSWKSHVENVDDGRKEVLRRRRDGKENGSANADVGDEDVVGVGGGDDDDDGVEANSKESKTIRDPSKNRRTRKRASKIPSDTLQNNRQRSSTTHRLPPSRRAYSKPSSSYKSRLEEVPFWREGGTLASLLFDTRPSSGIGRDGGRRRPMKRKSLEQLLLSPFGRDHTVTSLFLYISRSALTSLAILCRWAGVRGTIPQPIVVTTVFAMLVSSPRGQRMASVTLTLLALRLLGEFIHGSLHGNEFWDDEYDFEDGDWKDSKIRQ